MTITCVSCGYDRFRGGELELSPGGGYEVVMTCAKCGTPNRHLASNDPGLAQALVEFFKESGPGKFTHRLGS